MPSGRADLVLSLGFALLLTACTERVPKPIVSNQEESDYLYQLTISPFSVHGLDTSPSLPERPRPSGCTDHGSNPLQVKATHGHPVLQAVSNREIAISGDTRLLKLEFCRVLGSVEVVALYAGLYWSAPEAEGPRHEHLYGFQVATGLQLWHLDVPIKTPMELMPAPPGHLLTCTLGDVSFIDAATGARDWQWTSGQPIHVMSAGPEAVIVQMLDSVARLKLQTGAVVWQVPSHGDAQSIVGDHLIEARYVTNCAADVSHGFIPPDGSSAGECPSGQRPEEGIKIELLNQTTGAKEQDFTIKNVPKDGVSTFLKIRTLNRNEAVITLFDYHFIA